MTDTDELARRLADLDVAELTALLQRRPDVLRGPPPRHLVELAQRLWHPQSLVEVLRTVPLPHLQLVEAAQALSSECTISSLTEFLGGDGVEHARAVNRVLDELATWAVLMLGPDGRIRLPEAMAQIYPDPLHLGQPLRVLLADLPVDRMRRIQRQLGLPAQGGRAETVASLLRHLGDPGTLGAILGDAPEPVLRQLAQIASFDESCYDAGPRANRERQAAVEWGLARGLLIGRYGYVTHVPAELARALRGRDYRAPFVPHRPQHKAEQVDAARVEADSAAAATQLAGHVLAILDGIAGSSVTLLKAGGVGARELTRLGKQAGASDAIVRLSLELAHAAHLLDRDGDTLVTSPSFLAWRDLDPGERYAMLLRAWASLPGTPTEARGPDGKVLRALSRPRTCEGCLAARSGLLEALAEIDGATSCHHTALDVLWRRPLVHVVPQDENEPLATVWREAELLGVLADGALSELGRLLRGDVALLDKQAAALLPESTDRATFGSDLTAYATGAPSAVVSRLLDSAADRESRGGAVTWRFSPGSVRRALDNGATGDGLTTELAAVANGELPQPLTYLIGDVARRHGNLRVSAAVTVVRSDDEALLAQVAADRSLAKHGMRLLAPTVLASDTGAADLLAALRQAGYLPMPEGSVAAEVAPARRGPSQRTLLATALAEIDAKFGRRAEAPADNDPREVASALLRRGLRPADGDQLSVRTGYRSARFSGPGNDLDLDLYLDLDEASIGTDVDTGHAQLSELAPSLSGTEVRVLAHAIDTGGRVHIDYVAQSGKRTRRAIDRIELVGTVLFAWCELRNDERVFSLSGIRSVAAG